MIWIHGSAQTSTSKKQETEKKDKDADFKAEVVKEAQSVKADEQSTIEKLLQEFTLMARRHERVESRMQRYKKFYHAWEAQP